MIADALGHCEALLESEFVEIVEKNSAQAARLLAVFQVKIIVAPLLEARMQSRAEWHQRGAAGSMKMTRIFFKSIIRSQVHAAAEPPDRFVAICDRVEKPYVQVRRRRDRRW